MFKCKKQANKLAKSGLVIFIAAVLLLGLVACNRKGPLQSGILEEDKELNIDGNITFTISNESGDKSEAAAPRAFANAFMLKYKNVKVTVEEANRSTYATRISSGEIGDVFWCDENDANNYKKNHNALMMLDYYMDKLGIDRNNIYSGALRGGMIDGRLYLVPRNLGQQTLIYNKDAVKSANIQMPEGGEALSWDQFKDYCKRLTLEENGKYTQVGASFLTWWSPVWQAFAEGWGGEWVNTAQKKVSFTSSESVMKGINEMFEGCFDGWMNIGGVSYSGALQERYQGLTNLDYVFRTFGDMQWITAQGLAYDSKGVDWDFCSFPAFPTHKVGTGATGYVVYNRSRNIDTAAALALFFLTEDGQRAYHGTTGGNVPLLKTLANDSFWRFQGTVWADKNFDAFVSYPDASTPATVITRAPSEIAEILSDEKMMSLFGTIVNGKKSVTDAFSELETRCNEIWSTLNDFS